MVIAIRIVKPPASISAESATTGGGHAAAAATAVRFSLSAGSAPVYVVTAILSSVDTAEADPLPVAKAALMGLTATALGRMAGMHTAWWEQTF